MGTIDRDDARTWSRDRVKEQISELRSYIADLQDEVAELEERIDDLENNPRWEMSRSREDRIDGASDAITRTRALIDDVHDDIAFLMSLL